MAEKNAMIDAIDRQLIYELYSDGRLAYPYLAKKLDISVSTVIRRIEHMLQNGTIAIRAVPNPVKLGFLANATMLLDVSISKVDSVCQELVKKLNVNVVSTTYGRYDVICSVHFPANGDLFHFIKNDLALIDGIQQIETVYYAEIKKRYYGWALNNPADFESVEVDVMDRRLIELLEQNGRLSYKALAGDLNINEATVSKRFERLVQNDVIKIKAIPDLVKMGYEANAFIFLNAELGRSDEICNKLAQNENVSHMATLFGRFDIVAGVHFYRHDQLVKFIKEALPQIGGIQSMETFYIAENIKRYYGWSLTSNDI